MKNISRRVFIKGLAVAGVAAAASTVLAGCNTNMIPGVDDGEGEGEEVPSTPSVLEFTDKTNSKVNVKISALSMVLGSAPYAADNTAAIKLQVVNNLGQKLPLLVDAPASISAATSVASNTKKIKDGDYYVLVEAYNDGNDADEITVSASDAKSLAYVNTSSSNAPANAPDKDKTTVGYVYLTGVTAKESVSLKLTLKKCTKVDSTTSALVESIADQTFTFKV